MRQGPELAQVVHSLAAHYLADPTGDGPEHESCTTVLDAVR